ncbi:MAG: TonB-dependent receptor [Alphaproteobacteria bacterium]|nr:TonB-dependent receptor [Alphaproteobacteria bacterium]
MFINLRQTTLTAAATMALAVSATTTAQANSADGIANEEELVIETIVVTARKRTENLQDVPISIVAIGENQIDSLNAKSLGDLNGAVPNFRLAPEDGTLTIRGISSNARNSGFEAGAAVYVDGVYQGRPAGNNQDLTDIERVEVLRGPQGTLYGKNTTAGAVSIVTVRPGDEWTGRADVQYGERNDLRFSGYVAGPLTDQLGVKFSGSRRTADGFQLDLASGQKYANKDSWGVRGELLFQPEGMEISLRGDYAHDDSIPYAAEPVFGFSADLSPGMDVVSYDVAPEYELRTGGVSLTVDADLGGDYTITSITALRSLKTILSYDDDFGPLDLVFHVFDDEARQFSEEIRLSSPGEGPFTWVAGGYFFSQKLNSKRPVTLSTGFPVHGILNNIVETRTRAFAAFVNADYEFSDELTLNLGLRYTHERKELDFIQLGVIALGYPDFDIKDSFTDTNLSPTASLSYKISSDMTAYVKYSKGFKSGGWNPDITSTPNIKFNAENVSNYELGLRAKFIDDRLGINLTGYYMDYKELQVSQFLGTFSGYVVTNAGKARIKGVEAEIKARPVSWLSLTASGAYNDASYVDFATGLGTNYAGQQFTKTPKFSIFLAVDGSFPIFEGTELDLHIDYRYQSEIFFDDNRTVHSVIGPFAQSGYGILNANIGLVFDNGFEIIGFVDNLTNKRALFDRNSDALSLGLVLDRLIEPRRFGVRVAYTF